MTLERTLAPRDSKPPVTLVVEPRIRDLEGFEINRAWPTARRRLIGPFVFFDHLLPVTTPPARGFDVPPHPHIGLATITYLFAGELVHRDSLGIEQLIRPGELNWMTAGRGIVHSERSSDGARAASSDLHAIQAWVALPKALESTEPSFRHYASAPVPRIEYDRAELTIMAGTAFGSSSPALTSSELFFVEARLPSGARIRLDPVLGDRAVYVVSGSVRLGTVAYTALRLLVCESGADVVIEATADARLMLFGGQPLDGERHVWWNFVSSSREKIEAAKQAWRDGRFPKVAGDDGYMPLPE